MPDSAKAERFYFCTRLAVSFGGKKLCHCSFSFSPSFISFLHATFCDTCKASFVLRSLRLANSFSQSTLCETFSSIPQLSLKWCDFIGLSWMPFVPPKFSMFCLYVIGSPFLCSSGSGRLREGIVDTQPLNLACQLNPVPVQSWPQVCRACVIWV